MIPPFVTIAVPCLNEEPYIRACMECLTGQDYPRDRIEILVADGGSTDRTRAILQEMSSHDPRIRVIDNPARIQAAGMNQVIRESRGDVIIRMDVHTECDRDFVRKSVQVLNKTGADNVGGAQRAKAKTRFQRALAAALTSPLGVGGAKYRDASQEGFVDTVFLGAFRRRVFETVGLYDSNAITNEDAELNQRILEGGGKIYLSPEIVVHYYPRDSFQSLWRQYYKYGRGRARTLLKHGGLPKIRPMLPFLMVSSEAVMLAIPPLQPLGVLSLAGYAFMTGAEALRIGARQGIDLAPIIWGIFPVLHMSHGIGFATGLVHYATHKDWSEEPEKLSPRLYLASGGSSKAALNAPTRG